MWTHDDERALGVVELGPAASPDATPADDGGRADQLGPDRDRCDDRDLGRPDEPGDPALGVPRPDRTRGSTECTPARSCV